MRLMILTLIFIAGLSPTARAADGMEVFGKIFGGVINEIERRDQRRRLRKQEQHAKPIAEACTQGNLTSCEVLLQIPNLNAEARAAIEQIKTTIDSLASACDRQDRVACATLLEHYPALSQELKELLPKVIAAIDRHQKFISDNFEKHQGLCNGGDIMACDEALAFAGLTPADREVLVQKRLVAVERQKNRKREIEQRAREMEERRQQHEREVAERRAAESTRPTIVSPSTQPPTKPTAQHRVAASTEQTPGSKLTERGQLIAAGVMILISGIVLVSAFAGPTTIKQRRATPKPVEPMPAAEANWAKAKPEPSADPPRATALTGHFPTDVRAVFAAMSQEASHV